MPETNKPPSPPAYATPADLAVVEKRLRKCEDDLGAAVRELGLVREIAVRAEAAVHDALKVWSRLEARVSDTETDISKLGFRFNIRYPEVWNCPRCGTRLAGPHINQCPKCESGIDPELTA